MQSPSADFATTNIAPRPTETRNEYPQINISGNARVQLGDRINLPSRAAIAEDKEQRLLNEANQKRLNARARFENLVVILHFTSHWADIVKVHTDSSNNDLTAVSENFGQINEIPVLYKQRFFNDVTRAGGHVDCLSKTLFLEIVQSCVEVIHRFEAVLNESQHTEKWIDVQDTSNEIQKLQVKAIANVFLIVCLEHDTLRFSSSFERILSTHVRRLQTRHPKVLSDLVKRSDASQRWWLTQKLLGVQKVSLEDWFRQHESAFVECAEKVTSEFKGQHVRSVRSQIMASLNYIEMDHRYHAVTRAQAQTFDWMFTTHEPRNASNISFATWLADASATSDRLYWIRGKPGSGKSTLMRYLYEHQMTRVIAQTWSASKSLLIAKCFFWSSGSPMQRSQRGLLQSLLYQMLKARPDFPSTLCRSHWNAISFRLIASYVSGYFGSIREISVAEIQDAIANFASHHGDSCRILLLIDGLDEFEGHDEARRDVCAKLKVLTQNKNVKICTSSRPWNVYTDFFETSPQLRLELLTKDDVDIYVTGSLGANTRFSRWQMVQPEATQELIDGIVLKAEGVFLWVVLVVRSLLTGIHYGEDIQELRRRFEAIPSDLSDLFEQMLSRVDPNYLESASHIFEVALNGSHLLILYFFMHMDEQAMGLLQTVRERGLPRVLELQELEERRINARCMGLLDFTRSSECDMHFESGLRRVTFLHRTARDYMATQQQRLATWRKSIWDPQAVIHKSTLLLILSCDHTQPWLFLPTLAQCCQEVFSNLDCTPMAAECLDIIEKNEQHLEQTIRALAAQRRFLTWCIAPEDCPSLLTFAIAQGADVYAKQKIQALVTIDEAHQRPLLHYTVNPEYRNSRPPSLDLSTALLDRGANPNAVWYGRTVWSELLICLPLVMRKSGNDVQMLQAFANILKLLISAGASDFPLTGNDLTKQTSALIDSRRTIQTHFPEAMAKDILGVERHVRAYEDPHSFAVRVKARFRRWKRPENG